MELTEEQINKFKQIHEKYGGLDGYTDEQIRELANGVAKYYLALFNIKNKISKEVDISEMS